MNSRAPIMLSRHLRLSSLMNQTRWNSQMEGPRLPMPVGVYFTPQQEAWVIERFGKFHRTLEPGLNFAIPVVDKVRYIQSLKEIAIDIPMQSAITRDNVTLRIDGVLYLRIFDPYKASYGVESAEYAITQLAQTTMRSEIGKLSLDSVFQERESLNVSIVEAINKASDSWGITAQRYEIRDLKMPERIEEAMQMQVEAERKKRATVLESEGVREADINVAEGQKRSRILTSEAYKAEQINKAEGEALAVLAKAKAQAEAIAKIAAALGEENGHNAVSVSVAEKYIHAFEQLAKENNTILLPSSTGDISSMVTQAMSIYKNLDSKPKTVDSGKVITKEVIGEDGLKTYEVTYDNITPPEKS